MEDNYKTNWYNRVGNHKRFDKIYIILGRPALVSKLIKIGKSYIPRTYDNFSEINNAINILTEKYSIDNLEQMEMYADKELLRLKLAQMEET